MDGAEHNEESIGGSLPELREICLQNLDSFTSIIDLKNTHGRILKCSLLNHLKVCGCNQLKYLFPLFVLKDLQQLKTIDISDCKQLEHVFVDEKQDTQTTSSNVKEEAELPILLSLKLTNLPQLASITSGDVQIISRSLTQMTVENCPKFVFAFAYNLRSSEEQGPSPEKKSNEMIVTPSKLKYLDLHKVDHLEKICMYKDLLLSFMCLTSLQLWKCNKLEYLFSLSLAKTLTSLQELKIISCEKIVQIVKKETKERDITIEFPQVETLILEQLPKFTGSSSLKSSSDVKWLALMMVKIDGCPNIQKSMLGTVDRPLLNRVDVENCQPWQREERESNINYLFDLTDELSKIENLEIKDWKELKKYMEMELQESSFTQLKTVKVLQCDNELNKFLCILLDRSNNLEQLTIARCELLEQVFDLTKFVAEKQMKLRFPKLKIMQFLCLPNLKVIWNNNPMGILELGKLVKLEIIECGLRKIALSIVVVEKLVLLEELKIESCEMIEQVVEDDKEIHDRLFPNLKDLQLASLPKLTKFNLGHRNFIFPNLRRFRIEKCPELNVLSNQMLPINEGTSDHVLLNEMMHPCPKLQKLKLAGLEMLEDISQGKYSRIPLCDLEAIEVDSFSRLTHMWIARSEKLVVLVVRNCNSLRTLVLTSNCFNLKKIEISSCNILEDISTNLEQEKTDKKTFHNLESIILENLEKLSSFSLDTREFPSLRELRIVNCHMLETLPRNNYTKEDKALNKHSTLVLFDDEKEDSQTGEGKMKMPPLLESLELADLSNMRLWKQEPQITVFQNLTLLKIMRCRSFETLFSIPVAQHLSAMKLLTLYGCVNMVQVLGGGGGNSKRVFKKLETLVLKHLPRLTSFCEQDVDFGEFPELKMVRLEDVPNMNTFVKLPLKTPKLSQVHMTYITKFWLGDLNRTVNYLHENHDKIKGEVWESDQSNTRYHTDTAESLSQSESRFKEAA